MSEFGWQHTPSAPVKADLPGFPGELAALIRTKGEPLLDDLIVATGRSAPELLPTLMTLELQGVIRSLPSGRYSI